MIFFAEIIKHQLGLYLIKTPTFDIFCFYLLVTVKDKAYLSLVRQIHQLSFSSDCVEIKLLIC